jgi:hypothetical protein
LIGRPTALSHAIDRVTGRGVDIGGASATAQTDRATTAALNESTLAAAINIE